jgi:hypothetical protein
MFWSATVHTGSANSESEVPYLVERGGRWGLVYKQPAFPGNLFVCIKNGRTNLQYILPPYLIGINKILLAELASELLACGYTFSVNEVISYLYAVSLIADLQRASGWVCLLNQKVDLTWWAQPTGIRTISPCR